MISPISSRRLSRAFRKHRKFRAPAFCRRKFFSSILKSALLHYGLKTSDLSNILGARNITLAGGQLEAAGKNLSIDPSGEFKSEKEIGDVAISQTNLGAPVYLRDLVDIARGY